MSCSWTLDSNLNVIGVPWFGRSVIRSNHQLNYYQAQAILDDRSPPIPEDDLNDVAETGNVRKDLEVVANFSRIMNAERTKFGAVVSFFLYSRMGNLILTGKCFVYRSWRLPSYGSRRPATACHWRC